MKKIYSEAQPDQLVASILRFKDLKDYRTDICPESEYLQVSGRYLKKGTIVASHKHTHIDRESDITQEAWIILQGKIKTCLYDLDDSLLYEAEIGQGDCIVIFRGGHSLEVLEEDTIFYEFKNGPYYGADLDKERIAGEGQVH
tara:strand:+ start:509 stop:937 length:429 start_codon:yes stop_codon:yes gene_type:complete